MRVRRFVRWAWASIPCLAVAAAAPAAAQCLQGTRPLITSERQFFTETLSAIRSAVPEPPSAWRVADETDVRAPRGLCIGRERQPLSMEFAATFAPAAGDGAGVSGVVPAGHGGPHAGRLRLLVRVNARQALLDPHAERLSLADATLAFRDPDAGSIRTLLSLFIGDWSLFRPEDPGAALEAFAHFDTGVRHTRVQSLGIEIDGPEGPAADLLSRLDLGRLRQLLSPPTGR